VSITKAEVLDVVRSRYLRREEITNIDQQLAQVLVDISARADFLVAETDVAPADKVPGPGYEDYIDFPVEVQVGAHKFAVELRRIIRIDCDGEMVLMPFADYRRRMLLNSTVGQPLEYAVDRRRIWPYPPVDYPNRIVTLTWSYLHPATAEGVLFSEPLRAAINYGVVQQIAMDKELYDAAGAFGGLYEQQIATQITLLQEQAQGVRYQE